MLNIACSSRMLFRLSHVDRHNYLLANILQLPTPNSQPPSPPLSPEPTIEKCNFNNLQNTTSPTEQQVPAQAHPKSQGGSRQKRHPQSGSYYLNLKTPSIQIGHAYERVVKALGEVVVLIDR